MKRLLFIAGFLIITTGLFAQEYVQTTTNTAYANKSFQTSGKFSIGHTDAELIGGSLLNIKTNWGTWMALVDGYKNDIYAFHNPNQGGRMELFIHDGVTDTNKFGVFTIRRDGNIGIGTTAPLGKLHVMGDTYIDQGWLRVKGQKGLHFQDYGGGFFMKDNSWIRTSGDKNFYHNTGVMRTDGTFHVGPNGNRFIVNGSGNVGIGVTNPGNWKLNVKGHVNIGGDGNYRLRTRHVDGKALDSDAIDALHLNYNTAKPVYVGYGANRPHSSLYVFGNIRNGGADFQLGVHDGRNQGTKRSNRAMVHAGADILYLNYAGDFEGGTYIDGPKTVFTKGNVSIGTTNAQGYQLAVAGKVAAEEVKVALQANWPDYIFKESYQLPTLQNVENHIKEKGHLPNIPSALEVEKNGVFLGEMNRLLLEKIEELTLYTISQEKEIQNLKGYKTANEQLNKKVDQQEIRLKKLEEMLIQIDQRQ